MKTPPHASPRLFLLPRRAPRAWTALVALVAVTLGFGADAPVKTFNLPGGDAAATLKEFSKQSGASVMFAPEVVAGVTTKEVAGRFTVPAALERLLAGTSLIAVPTREPGAYAIKREAPDPNESRAAPPTASDRPGNRSVAGAGASLSGRVSNAATRVYLEGAMVELRPLGRSTLTDASGAYQFADLPAGEHGIVVTYSGLDPQRHLVAVAAGQASTRDFELTSAVYQLEAFTVTGEREGNAAAITRQRHADSVVNVVATDAYGNVADGNLGNFMQRLPGVGVIIENGDVIGFGVRGTPSELNAVNIDGVRASSAFAGSSPQGDRAAIVDSIPAEFIKEIELVKALTPDRAADSVGGATNLITKSALDVKGSLLTFRAGLNQNTYRREERGWTPTGAFSYLTKLGAAERLGLAVSGSYTETTNTRDRVQMTRNQVDGRNTQARTLNDMATRTRGGGGVKLNFRPDAQTDLHAAVQYTYFSFQQDRTDWSITAPNVNVASYSVVGRAQIEAGAAPRTAANAAAGVAPGYTDAYTELLHANFVNTQGGTARHSRNTKFDLSGTRKLAGDQTLKAQVSYNPSVYDFVFQFLEARRTGGIGLAIDSTANRDRPRYLQTYGPSIEYGGSLLGYTALRAVNDEHGEEEFVNAALDYDKRGERAGLGWQFKSGLSWRQQHRTLDVFQPRWNYVGPDGVAGNADDNLAQFRRSEPGYGLFNGEYPRRDQFDNIRFREAFEGNPAWFREQGTTVSAGTARNEITEDVYAAYALGRVQAGRLGLLGGVRYEATRLEASGRLTDPRNPAASRATREGDYAEWFPSLHLRYEPRRDLLVRASYSTGAARPSFGQLYPRTVVSYNNTTGLGQVTQNDPSLSPQYSRNYDAAVEYYFRPVGVLSAGYFHKEISDFISAETRLIAAGADNGFDGQYEGFDLVTNRNFGSATIKGFELNYSQQLRRLPKPFDSLSVFANYTKIKSRGDYGNGSDELVRFIPETTNAGLSWRLGRFEWRASYNFKSGYLNTYNAALHARQRVTDVETWDFTLQARLSSRYTAFVDIVNAFNQWASWYSGDDPGRVIMSEVYGMRLTAGVSGRF
jgi:iron complex outermembrane receptor protein